jgi:UDP-glucuronate 4-epimerase
MAIFGFTRKILAGEPIDVFGNGQMARDFTYIDDIVDGILGALDHVPAPGENRILNIGNSHPETLDDMIGLLEAALGTEARKRMLPMQPGDVTSTFADISKLAALIGYAPKVRLREGLERFVDWYRSFYG